MSGPMPIDLPPGGDESRGPALLGIVWAEAAVCIVVVGLRFFVRGKKKAIGADDWLMLIACLLMVAVSATVHMIVRYGLARHIYYVSSSDLMHMLKWIFILQVYAFYTLVFAKASIAILLMRLMGPERHLRKWFMWANVVLFTLSSIVLTVLSFTSCTPYQANWDLTLKKTCVRGASGLSYGYAVFITSYSAFLDFLFAFLPVTLLWNLRMSMPKKLLVCVLLGVGSLAGVAAVIKATQLRILAKKADFTWHTFSMYAWSESEYFLNILCGCIPTLKPLYDLVIKGRPIEQSPSGGPSIFWSNASMWSDRVRKIFTSSSRTSRESGRTDSDMAQRNNSDEGPFITVHQSAKVTSEKISDQV